MRAMVLVMTCAIACHGGDRCVPGQQRSCDCAGALVGAQVCNADGEYPACTACAPADAWTHAGSDAAVDARIDGRPDAAPDADLRMATGAPCMSNTDCLGAQPLCLTSTAFPGGYCTSACDTADNDPQTGIDPNCPGLGQCTTGSPGQCLAACTAHGGAMPCRAGYSCFSIGCAPDVFSQCDPTIAGSCGIGESCEVGGPDPVGSCVEACDLFAQGCLAATGGTPQGCYIVNALADGTCEPTGGLTPGAACDRDSACAPGLACHSGACRVLCGGPTAVTCATGACVDYSAAIPSTTVGVCAP